MKKILFFSMIALAATGCCKQKKAEMTLLNADDFKTTVENCDVALYTLHSGAGLTAQITNYGGRIVSLFAPDRQGKYEDVVFGFDNIADYIANKGGERYLGPVIGRYGNRIANAQFVIDGTTYTLPANDATNCLHGGLKGFDSHAWNVDSVAENFIALSFTSPDGDEGFPGTVAVKMTYELSKDNELIIKYFATTDKPTHINLTNHSQFNLKGAGNGEILDHILKVNSKEITPVDSLLIPTGTLMVVEETPFDFQEEHAIGERINADNEQIKLGRGYDHNWVIDRQTAAEVEFVASVYEPSSGRLLEVFSDQPGVQIYTGNFFTSKVEGKYGKMLLYRGAVALETQKYPNTPNQPNFPTTLVQPNEIYTQTCIYKFSVK